MRSELFEEAISEHNPLYKEGLSQDQFYKGAEWAWQQQQSKVDELQKKNAWLSGVACRENKRANKLQEEKVSTTTLLGKTIQEKNELQKRVDELELAIKGAVTFVDLQIEATEQGREAAIGTKEKNWWSSKLLMLRPIRRVLEQALKGGGE